MITELLKFAVLFNGCYARFQWVCQKQGFGHCQKSFSEGLSESLRNISYLYADLVGVMDKNKLVQYQTGVVNGVKITPEFLTVAAGFMQVSLANVFLPQVIKNERTLRWVQIASGTLMTLVQSATLFVGKPTPYYVLFSAIEIGTTAYITFDAIKWKPKKKNKIVE